jgi:hypothetical protein
VAIWPRSSTEVPDPDSPFVQDLRRSAEADATTWKVNTISPPEESWANIAGNLIVGAGEVGECRGRPGAAQTRPRADMAAAEVAAMRPRLLRVR